MKFDKEKLLTTLKKNHIFNQISDNSLQKILPKLKAYSYDLGNIIVNQGSSVDGYYVVFKGNARLIDVQNNNLKLKSLKKGDGFGENCIFSNNVLNGTVKSYSKLTLIKIPSTIFYHIVINHPKIKEYVYQYQQINAGTSAVVNDNINTIIHQSFKKAHVEEKDKRHKTKVKKQFDSGHTATLRILRNNSIFGLLSDNLLKKYLHFFTEQKYKLGDVIIRQGQIVDAYFVIVNGNVRLIDQNNNNLSLLTLTQNDGFGEQAFDSKQKAIMTVRSSGKLTLYKLPANKCNELFVNHLIIKKAIDDRIQYLQGSISLKKVPIFSNLSAEHIKMLYNVIDHVEINKNEYIFHEGDYGDAAYVVQTGSIRIIKEDLNKTFAICRSGEIVGEISLIKSQPRIASGIAVEKTKLFKITRDTFENILPEIKDTIENIVKNKLQQHKRFTSDNKSKEKTVYPKFITGEYKISNMPGSSKTPYVKVNHSSLSGMACVKLILDTKNTALPPKWQQRSLSKIEKNHSDNLLDISLLLEEAGLFTRKARISSENIQKVPLPAIVMDENSIPQVIFEINHQQLLCSHPLKRVQYISLKDFNDTFQNEILMVSIVPEFRQVSEKLLSIYKRFFEMVLQYKDILYWIIITSFLLMLFGFAAPFFTQIIIDNVLIFKDKSLLHLMLWGMMCITVFQLTGEILRKFLTITIFQRIESVMNGKFLNHILMLKFESYARYNIGEYTTRFGENRKLIDLFSQTGMTLTMDVLVSVFYFGQLLIQDSFLTFIGLSFILIQFFIVMLSSKKLRENDKKVFKANTENESFIIRMLTGIQTVKSLAGEEFFYKETISKFSKQLQVEFDGARMGFNLSLAISTLSNFSKIAILLFGSLQVIKQELSLGEFLAFNSIFGLLLIPIGNLTNIWDEIQEIRISIERINDVLELPVEKNKEYRESITIKGHIVIENLCFQYKGMEKDVLSNINLEILPGKNIAFVGRSGCGKSTLINLILGLYEPYSGAVYIDNKDVNSLSSRSILSHIGIVEQKPRLFSGTIKENIAISDPGLSIEQINKAASISGVKEFTDKLPFGLNTHVGEGGVGLSGGQAQKVVIARAIVRNPEILILDEATSALDNEVETFVMNNLKQLMKGRTTISITHKLETLIHSDTIVVLDEGKIVETGTHEELIRKQSLYNHLFTSGEYA